MPNPIDYASPSTSTRRPPSIPLVITLLVLTALAVIICLTIEVLNAQAGFYLPHTELPAGSNGKWRSAPAFESFWRLTESNRRGDPSLKTRPLTAAETASMLADIRPGMARNRLKKVVSSVGLLQYPLTTLLILALTFACFANYERRWKIRLRGALVLTLFCAIMMFYRGYFTSLGW